MTWLDWLLLGICLVLLWSIVSNLLNNWRWFSSLQLLITDKRTTVTDPGSNPQPPAAASDTVQHPIMTGNGSLIENDAVDNLAIPDQYKIEPTVTDDVLSEPLDQRDIFNYVASIKGNRFHTCDCGSVTKIQEHNRQYFEERAQALSAGYIPCGICNP